METVPAETAGASAYTEAVQSVPVETITAEPTPMIEPATETEAVVLSGTYYLRSAYDGSYLCADNIKWNRNNGKSGFHLYAGFRYDNNRILFHVRGDDDGLCAVTMTDELLQTLYLDVWNSNDSESAIDLWPSGSYSDQRWKIERQSDGTYYLRAAFDNSYVLTYDLSHSGNEPIRLSKENSGIDQKWDLVLTDDASFERGYADAVAHQPTGLAEAYARQLQTMEGSDRADAFLLLDMDRDGIYELITIKTEHFEGTDRVSTDRNDGLSDNVTDFSIYAFKNGQAVLLVEGSNSMSNNIFQIYDGRALVTGDSGTGYFGYTIWSYDGDRLFCEELDSELQSAPYDGSEENIWLYDKYPFDSSKGSVSLTEISEQEHTARETRLLNNMAVPKFFANNADGRNAALAADALSDLYADTELLCSRLIDTYGAYLDMTYGDIYALHGIAESSCFVEGENLFRYVLDGVTVEFELDEMLPWDEMSEVATEPDIKDGWWCIGSLAHEYTNPESKCIKVISYAALALIEASGKHLEPEIAGAVTRYYPEGPEVYLHVYNFTFAGYEFVISCDEYGVLEDRPFVDIKKAD
ncbi:MAG: RICIN domain-containing protein [Clostridia bacterium]|nr:RICIN domain-containing protein [Clostridia bacterium]